MKLLIVFLLFLVGITAEEVPSYEKAVSLFRAGNLEEARSILQNRAKNPGSTVADHILLSHCLFRLGAVNPAIDELYAALKLKPTDPEIYIELVKFISPPTGSKVLWIF